MCKFKLKILWKDQEEYLDFKEKVAMEVVKEAKKVSELA